MCTPNRAAVKLFIRIGPSRRHNVIRNVLTPLASLFTPPVVVGVAADAMRTGPLFPEEEAAVAGAAPARRADFTAGRTCARALLAALGVGPVPIPRRPDGAPAWPAGVVGSISHCRGLCAVAVAPAGTVVGLGLDVELADPFEPGLLGAICRPDELAALAAHRERPPAAWGPVVFSAKEAFYKCYRPLTGRFLELADVAVDVDPATSSFIGRLTGASLPLPAGHDRLHGRYALWDGFVACGVTLR